MKKYLMNVLADGSIDTEENWLAEMPSWEEGDAEQGNYKSREDQFASLVEMEPITEDDEAAICEWLNCAEASVSYEGAWVCGPMTGHWLKEDEIIKYLEWRCAQ
jgi:hypothetical protein